MAKNQKLTVQVSVTAPAGVSKAKVAKELATLLKGGNLPEGFKLGSPKVLEPVAKVEPATALA